MPSKIDLLSEETAKQILNNLRQSNSFMRMYLKKWTIDSWDGVFELARSGAANRVMNVGDQIIGKYTIGANEYDCPWDVLGFRDVIALVDGQEVEYENVPIIQMHYTNHENVVFDYAEMIEATEETALAGIYYFGVSGSTWTALNLEEGASIPYTDYDHVYVAPWNSQNAIRYGNSTWAYSWARQYLNNKGTGWATKQHDYDVLPSNAEGVTGFMSYLEDEMTDKLHPIKIQTRQANYLGSGLITSFDKFWLPSVSEMNMSNGSASADDGEPFEYYKQLLDSDTKKPTGTYEVLKKYAVNATTTSQNNWLRSAILGAQNCWYVNSSGSVDGGCSPTSAFRLAPACAIV